MSIDRLLRDRVRPLPAPNTAVAGTSVEDPGALPPSARQMVLWRPLRRPARTEGLVLP